VTDKADTNETTARHAVVPVQPTSQTPQAVQRQTTNQLAVLKLLAQYAVPPFVREFVRDAFNERDRYAAELLAAKNLAGESVTTVQDARLKLMALQTENDTLREVLRVVAEERVPSPEATHLRALAKEALL
jgi:hypothetical protein